MSPGADEPSRARDLHALSGVLPVGVFLVLHLWTSSRALAGQEAFERAVGAWQGFPLATVLEIVLVLVPLVFHALYGVVLLVRTRELPGSPYPRHWRILVRGAAWVAFVFIAYHVYALGVPRWTNAIAARSMHTALTMHLSRGSGSAAGLLMPWTALFYLVGVAATIVHFAAGTWGFLVRTHRVGTASGRKQAAYGLGAAAAALFAISSMTILHLATGTPLYAAVPDAPPCPAPPLPASASASVRPAAAPSPATSSPSSPSPSSSTSPAPSH